MNNKPKTRIPVKKPQKESNEEDSMSASNTSTSINPNHERFSYHPKGLDWRKMFDEAVNCDITIDVDGNIIKAHKSVLISRCQYFAAMFSGKSKDSINVMYLDGFSLECVHFALCQIYSENTDIPQNIDIFELADLADLLNMEGLKELVSDILERDYFHSFHKPCDDCIYLISKFLPWSGTIGYTEIYYKILQWIENYCDEIWSKKEFASLPYDVIKKCFTHHTLQLDIDNVIEIVQRCEKLMYVLPKVSWTAYIFRLSLQLLRDCVRFMSAHLADILSTEKFLLLGKAGPEEISRLEDRLTAAIEHANPLQLCSAYAQLHRLLRAPSDQMLCEWRDLLTRLAIHCEDALVSCASQAMSTSAWVSLQPDLQARIRTYSGIMPSSTFSKFLNTTTKSTRERNIERIKYILYSQLGNINRVPTNASRQHLPAPTASKRFFVAPGNSMVTSTKSAHTNLRNPQPVAPSSFNFQYKDVKSRYLNPKPAKNDAVTLTKKPLANHSPLITEKRSAKQLTKMNRIEVNKKLPGKNSDPRVSHKPVNKHLDNRLTVNCTNSDQHSLENSKNKLINNSIENQTKVPVKNPPVFYVSPYSYKPSENPKIQKALPKTNNNQNSTEKFKDLQTSSSSSNKKRFVADSISPEKKNISVSDTALSVESKRTSRDSPRSILNKSPTFKRSTFETSSTYSSPISQSSQKTNSAVYLSPKLRRESPCLNIMKSSSSKDVTKTKISGNKGKSLPTFAQSTVSSSAKIASKTIGDSVPNSPNFSHNSKKNNPSNVVNNILENVIDDVAQNEVINSAMTRSRTFLKKEPSIISKEITQDSSIEMYPE